MDTTLSQINYTSMNWETYLFRGRFAERVDRALLPLPLHPPSRFFQRLSCNLLERSGHFSTSCLHEFLCSTSVLRRLLLSVTFTRRGIPSIVSASLFPFVAYLTRTPPSTPAPPPPPFLPSSGLSPDYFRSTFPPASFF